MSCEHMAKIRAFSWGLCDYVLIPSNIRSHSKQSSTSAERPKIFQNKQKVRLGNIRSKSAELIRILLLHSLTHSYNVMT